MTEAPGGTPGGSKGVAFTNWLVSKAAGVLERKSSRRGFILGSAMVGSAVAVAGCAPGTQPGSPYSHITDCAGGLCTDGYTEFCCTINNGLNACPADSFIGGWWRADYSSFCNGTRYYMDCMQFCCGPNLGNGFCAGCTECTCAGGCDTRRIYCNYFRYGQCHQEIGITGPIACRVVTCVPPYTIADYACSTAAAVDNSTAEHAPAHGCTPPPPPFVTAAVLPMMGAATANGSGRIGVFGRRWASDVTYAEFNGSTWGPTIDLGGAVSSGIAAAVDPSGLYAFARGAGNNQLWYQCNTGSGWAGGWTLLGGALFSDPAVVSDPAGLFVFVRGGDDAVWYQRAQSGAFASDFTSLGGKVDSDPVAARDSTGVYVFARGPYGAVYYQRFSGGSWSGWQGMGGSATSDPWAVSDPAGLFVFVRGGGNSLYWGRFTGGTWSGWQPLDGVLTSDPFAVSTSSGPYVFARGGDNATWFRTFTGGSWSPWGTLGGATVAGPVAAFDPASGLFVFVVGTDGALYYQRLTSGWSGWQDLGGDFAPVRGGR